MTETEEFVPSLDTPAAEAAPETAVVLPDGRPLLARLRDWLATVPDDHPYNDLVRLAREAGWDWLLRQSGVQPNEANVTVTFDMLIGRVGEDRFDYVDQASIMLPATPGPISVGARVQINPTILFMLFGRLPPAARPVAPAQDPVTVDMDDDDVELPGGEPESSDDDIDPMVAGADVPPWTPGTGLPDVVVSREGGIPVFADLDDIKAPAVDIIVAVTNEVNAALVKMTSVDQVMDMWDRNAPVFGWLQDFATPEQRSAIAGAFKRRRGQIEGGFTDVAPRRRGAGV